MNKPVTHPIRSRRLTLIILMVFTILQAFCGIPDTSRYLPQIRFTATGGFGPYKLGTVQQNTLIAYDLPVPTTSVKIRFLDADSVQIGTAFYVSGGNIDSVAWNIRLDSMNLPLSPMVNLHLTYDADSVADYYVPYTVYPDTVSFSATQGWGPFLTNNYTFSDTSWHPVPELSNNFTVGNLPPRTDTVTFQVVVSDSVVIRTQTVSASPGTYLESAAYTDVRMDNLPVNTSFLNVIINASGAPGNGLAFHKNLQARMHEPRLYSQVSGIHLTDSIAPVNQNPWAGQALLVDSSKYAVITNGPGIQMTSAPYFYQGPYSVDILQGHFTIEGWFRLDLNKINQHTNNSMTFLRVDSLFEISLYSEFEASGIQLSSLIGGELLQLYYIDWDNGAYNNQEWHHFAYVSGDPYQFSLFYLDGFLLGAYTNDVNGNYIYNTYNKLNYMKTKPLILGGCNAQHTISTGDLSFVTALDEIRIWNRALNGTEINQHIHDKILQSPSLTGYWNFDDQRNRLKIISDLSYSNNSGQLYRGATFIPENPDLYSVADTLTLKTSNAATDSVLFSFLDGTNTVVDSVKLKVQNHAAQLVSDLSDLPYTVKRLQVKELLPGEEFTGQMTDFALNIIPPAPVATPQCNWGNYYYSADNYGSLSNPILLSGLPGSTSKVELGLVKQDTVFDDAVFTENSVPYQYSLHLNGTDNYIETSQNIMAPSNFSLSLWFRTTSTQGGKLIGFCDTQNGITSGTHDREILLETDGSLRFMYYNNNTPTTLFGSNKYNDGAWHCVTVSVTPPQTVTMEVDGALVAFSSLPNLMPYQGYWVIGHNGPTDGQDGEAIASYLQADLAYISIWTSSAKASASPDPSLLNDTPRGSTLFMLNEGTGTTIHDSQGGNNGTLMGSTPQWYSTNKVSMVRWQNNMLALKPGTYTSYAKVFYPGSPATGVTYPLGTYTILNPLPGYDFGYYLTYGNGYFNQGTEVPNFLAFETDYTGQGNPSWTNNFVRYFVMSPNHEVIDQGIVTWTTAGHEGSIDVDMGDALPGSYLAVQIGYQTSATSFQVASTMTIPVLIRPMLAPTVSGNFGPFEQAIAPGTMAQPNTFTLTEENLTDLSKVVAKFYDMNGNEIATAEGVNVNDTTWQVTQNMAVLSPPESQMTLSYYLGTNNFLGLVAGPYKITVHKTRPGWFDVIPDSAFQNIQQNGDVVTFLVATPFDNDYVIDNAAEMDIPSMIPLIGGSSCKMQTPQGQASLKYTISQSKLSLNGPPVFFQKVWEMGGGDPKTLQFNFNYAQNNTYTLTATNDLLAEQNFSMGGDISSQFDKQAGIVQQIKNIIQAASVADPESIIVSPSFELGVIGSFKYSSRLNLRMDTLNGTWGSYGNLDVDANPAHTAAYANSASYHFYGGSLGIEFSVGAKFLEGLIEGYFGLQARFDLGFGHSYVTIPTFQRKPLKSFTFETYGRFYIDFLWDWYEKDIWGPKLFYSNTLWGDDLTDAFPPAGNLSTPGSFKTESIPSGLTEEIRPVSSFSQMHLPRPQSSVEASDDCLLIDWMEAGSVSGERKLRCQYLNFNEHDFSDRHTITTNHAAMNSPSTHLSGDSLAILTWAQSRYDKPGFSASHTLDPMSDFIRSQDIWFAVFNLHTDSLIGTHRLFDDTLTSLSGRAEANPKVVFLSPSRAIVAWQVIQDDLKSGNIWYTLLEKGSGGWSQSIPSTPVTNDTDIKTQVKLTAAPGECALLAWINTGKAGDHSSTVRTSLFNGTGWSVPATVSAAEAVNCNYFDLKVNGENGGLAYTFFVEDTVNGHHEKLAFVPWSAGQLNTGAAVELLTDSSCHLQLPSLALHDNGTMAVAIKREILSMKTAGHKISQIDVFKNPDASQPGNWLHAEANPVFCDTMRQVSELKLGFINHDTLLLLCQENELFASNAASIPRHGRIFGDPYMDQVLRCFAFHDDGSVDDVDENNYFTGIDDPRPLQESTTSLHCFPNPCSDHTTITFYVETSGPVTLELYSMTGTRIATLFDRQLTAGYYETGVNTSLLQSGTYLCRLSGEKEYTFKLVVNH